MPRKSTFRSGDLGYESLRSGFNLAVAHQPEIIVDAGSVEDIVSAVRSAADAGRAVAVMNTGHGPSMAASDAVLIRTGRMRGSSVAAAFKLPANELRNLTVPADDIFGSRQSRSLSEPNGLDNWIRSVEPDDRTAFAVKRLESQSVSDTAEELGITTRQLLRVFVTNTGLAPKTYQRVLRLKRFIAEAARWRHLATSAVIAGCADQAHLTREVRELTGLTPIRLLEERSQTA